MTDEEKAEEYFCEHCENSSEHDNGHCSNCSKWDYFIAGLAEGRKEGYEQGKNNERKLQCGKKNYEKDTARLEKENAELKKELKICQSVASEMVNKMKNCGNCRCFTHKLLNCENIRICKINPNNTYGVCDMWEIAE